MKKFPTRNILHIGDIFEVTQKGDDDKGNLFHVVHESSSAFSVRELSIANGGVFAVYPSNIEDYDILGNVPIKKSAGLISLTTKPEIVDYIKSLNARSNYPSDNDPASSP